MALRPLTPQTPLRMKWDARICVILEDTGMTTSDAQGLMEAYGTESDQWFAAGVKPERAADMMIEPLCHVTINGQTYSLEGETLLHYGTNLNGGIEWNNPTEVDLSFRQTPECLAAYMALKHLNYPSGD